MELLLNCLLFLLLLTTDIHGLLPFGVKPEFEHVFCSFRNVTIGSTFRTPGHCKMLSFESVNFAEPSQELFDSLADGLDSLRLLKSTVKSVYLPNKLIDFHLAGARNCSTQLIIGDNATFDKLEKICLETLPEIPANLDRLHSLKVFEGYGVSGDSFFDLTLFTRMTHLESIVIADYPGVTISDSLELPSLRKLFVRHSPVILHNDTICKFLDLLTLYLENNTLQEIPEYFYTFTNLTRFVISRNRLQRVALDKFANMKQLETLNLSQNNISEITVEIQLVLPRLWFLSLAHNNLATLNATLWRLSSLKYLTLSDNRLRQVPGLLDLITDKVHNLHMQRNPWDCEWMVETMQNIPGIEIFGLKNGSCYCYRENFLL